VRSRRRLGLCKVASSSPADVIDGALLDLSLSGSLALELFIEREDCLLGAGVDVPCSSSAARKLRVSLWETVLEEGGCTSSGGA